MSFTEFVALVLAVNIVCAVVCAFLAQRWGRDPFGWVLAASAIGPFALVGLVAVRSSGAPSEVISREGGSPSRPGLRVLLPTDGSEGSLAAVGYVVKSIGPRLGEATVLTVLPSERADDLKLAENDPRRSEGEADIDRRIDPSTQALSEAGLPFRAEVRFGVPAEEINRLASDGGYDLVVLGRRGAGKAARLLLGSVADEVAKKSPVPVTVVG